MKLTNYHRDAFIRAAMDDVPKLDYPGMAQRELTQTVVDAMPSKVRAVYNDKATRDWIKTCVYTTPRHFPNIGAPGLSDYLDSVPESIKPRIEELARLSSEQTKQRSELEGRLHSIAYACSTRKALVEALPEFEKYAPADSPQATRQLPVVANVVADFVKAGWPKSAPKTKVKAA
jgi:hypothetical protein